MKENAAELKTQTNQKTQASAILLVPDRSGYQDQSTEWREKKMSKNIQNANLDEATMQSRSDSMNYLRKNRQS